MPLHKVLAVLFLILVVVPSGIAQEEKRKIFNKDGQLEITPEMLEKAKQREERLRDPSFIKLKIEPQSNCQDEETKKVSDCYQAHSKIQMKIWMTNVSSESINITINRYHHPYRPELFRDGQSVLYRKAMAEIVDKPPSFGSSLTAILEPGKAKMVDVIYLDEWYEPLDPGHYQLDVKWRFLLDGGWTHVASTTFEVEAK